MCTLHKSPVWHSHYVTAAVLWQAAKRAQAEHKAAKEHIKQSGLAVNSAKREIDHVTSALGAKRAEGVTGEADVLDSEEHQLVQTLKAAKTKFRRLVSPHKRVLCVRYPFWLKHTESEERPSMHHNRV